MRLTHESSAVGLVCDTLLLDADDRACDALHGSCASLPLDARPEQRSTFVCLGAELLRHAFPVAMRIGAIEPVVSQLRDQGVGRAPLMAAARLLDMASSEEAVVDSLSDMLVRSLGAEEARPALDHFVARLIRSRLVSPALRAAPEASLPEQLLLLVNGLGKYRARHVLRIGSDFDLVPRIEMYRA